MKEQYISPEARLLCLVPAQRVASLDLNFNDFLVDSNSGNTASMDGDIKVTN